jgi:hypothetical protein
MQLDKYFESKPFFFLFHTERAPAASLTHRHMIRERVSARGLIRPLEPETDLPAIQVPSDLIGIIPERAIERYVTAKERSDKKFAQAIKRIEKQRLRNIDRASRDMNQHVAALQHYLDRESRAAAAASTLKGTGADRMTRTTSSWNMAWALDEDERPPPSSIVARRDTEESLKLARVADKAVLASERYKGYKQEVDGTSGSRSTARGQQTGFWREIIYQ